MLKMNSNKFENIERFIELYDKVNHLRHIETIEWDDLENGFIDNLGNCYKSITDIPEELDIEWIENPKLSKFYSLQGHVIRGF